MAAEKTTIVTEHNFGRYSKFRCAALACQKGFAVGDTVISKNAGNGCTYKVKHFHRQCYENLYFEA